MFKPKHWLGKFVALVTLACAGALASADESGNGYDPKPQYVKFNLKRGYVGPQPTEAPWAAHEKRLANRDDYRATYDPTPFYSSSYDSTPDYAGMFETDAPPLYRAGFEGSNSTARPPDPAMAAGPSDLCIARNTTMVVREFDGTLISSATFNTLLGTSQFLSDPHIEYDPYSNRFVGVIISIDDLTDFENARWWIFYSNDSTAEGTWTAFATNARFNGSTEEDIWADYPHIAITNDAICVGAIMFATPAGSGDSFGKLRFADKADVYNGGGLAYKDFWNLTSDGTPDKRPVPCSDNGSPSRFYVVSAKEGGASNITVREYDDTAGGNFGNATNLLTLSVVPVASYATPPDGRQPSTTANLDNSDSRILEAMVNNGAIYAVHTTARAEAGGGNSSAIKAYKLQTNNGSAPTVLLDDIQFLDEFDYFYPGIAGTEDGDAVIVFVRSGETEFGSVRFTGFRNGDTQIEPTSLAKAGENALTIFSSGRVRYGDYFTCALDPYDGRNVWFHGEYGGPALNGAGSWVAAANYKPDYVILANNSTIQQSDTGTLTANVKRSDTNANVSGKSLSFYVNNVFVGSDISDANGNASVNYTVPGSTFPTTRTIRVDAAKTTLLNEGSDSSTLTITKANSAIQISNETGVTGQTVIFDIQLIRAPDGVALASQPINVTINGVAQPVVNTNGSGFAQLSYTITNPVGVYNVTASYAGNLLQNAVSDITGVLTVNKGNTNLVLSPQSGVIGSSVNLVATLERTSDGLNLSGRTVSFAVGGVNVGSAVTNASGVATRSWTVSNVAPGSVLLEASWLGDAQYNADTSSSTFTRQSGTALTINSPSGQRTSNITFNSTLRRTWDNAVLSGKTVNFIIDGVPSGSAVTNASGTASLNYVVPAAATLGAGHTVAVSFSAEALYTGSSNSGPWTVLQPSFNGRVNFLDWVGSEAGQTVQVTIRNGANAIVQGPTNVVTTTSGNWTLPTSLGAAADYKVSVKGSHWLRKQKLAVSLNTTTGTALIIQDLINGDSNPDNVIDLTDYTIVAVSFNALLDADPVTPGNQSSPNWNVAADLNGDGVVDLTDYTIVAVGFNLIGEP